MAVMTVTGPHAGVDPLPHLRNSPVMRHGRRAKPGALPVLSASCGCFLLGCLPVGTPPAGHHVVADRTLTGVYLSPSEMEGVPSHLLVTGPSRQFPRAGSGAALASALSGAVFADLYSVPYDGVTGPASGLADWQPTVPDFVVSYPSLVHGTVPSDSLGRLLVTQFSPAAGSLAVERIDPTTLAAENLGIPAVIDGEWVFALSPARKRLFIGESGSGQLCDLEACQSIKGVSKNIAFIGEDFYYTDASPAGSGASAGNLYRIDPGAQPKLLVSFTGEVSVRPIVGDLTPQLLLFLATGAGDAPFALIDTETLKTTSLPPEKGQAQFVSSSSDGHWLAFLATMFAGDSSRPADHRIFLYDWPSGSFATVDSASAGRNIGTTLEWRPGQEELWFSTLPDGFGIWRPDGRLTVAQATLEPYLQSPEGNPSVFTRDGRHWFSVGAGENPTRPTIYVGSSDDPKAPLQPLNPSGTVTISHWETDDGRLLVEAWTVDANRKDIYLVDADAGSSRAIASAGHLVALGHSRALALLDWESARAAGDLTLIDLASGKHTLLAQDVYDLAVDRGTSASVPPGTDALASGTLVAFLTDNRLASPWDGLWVVTLP